MRTFILGLLIVFCLLGADAPYDGRWNIFVQNEPRGRAWWLEVKRGKGRFVGAPGGGLYDIPHLSTKDGDLVFSFEGAQRRAPDEEYRAHIANGRLRGTLKAGKEYFEWTGLRAPEITDRDDGSWTPGEPIPLFNGFDITGWKAMIPDKPLGWAVKDGSLTNVAGANNLISTRRFFNYDLHAEFRVGAHSNSGIGLRGRYEVQILEDFGKPMDSHGNGALYSRIVPSVNASKPAGEWQTFDIRLVGRDVTVVLNGKKVIDKGLIEGLTAVANNPDEGAPGPFILQGDHGPVEFRKLVVTPLKK